MKENLRVLNLKEDIQNRIEGVIKQILLKIY